MNLGSRETLAGLSTLINEENARNDINYEEIEKEFLGGKQSSPRDADPAKDYKDEMLRLADELEISFNTPTIKSATIRNGGDSSYKSVSFDTGNVGHISPISVNAPINSPMNDYSTHRSAGQTPFIAASPAPKDDTSASVNTVPRQDFDDFDYDTNRRDMETELSRRTNDEIKHDHIRGVMNDIGDPNKEIFNIDNLRRDDEKLSMLEEIFSLRMSLEEDNAQGLDKIPVVDTSSSYEDVNRVLRSLRIMNDRIRYCSLADEFLLWGAQGMGELFNGERTWFGKYQPNLQGWDAQVAVKLRRMRHETSELVASVLNEYNIGSGPRIILELIPNMFMYARKKKQEHGEPDLFDEIEAAESKMNNIFTNIRNIDDGR